MRLFPVQQEQFANQFVLLSFVVGPSNVNNPILTFTDYQNLFTSNQSPFFEDLMPTPLPRRVFFRRGLPPYIWNVMNWTSAGDRDGTGLLSSVSAATI